MRRADIEEMFVRLAGLDPAPTTELQSTNPYTLLVAVVLSAQATDVGVNKATGPLFAVALYPRKRTSLPQCKMFALCCGLLHLRGAIWMLFIKSYFRVRRGSLEHVRPHWRMKRRSRMSLGRQILSRLM